MEERIAEALERIADSLEEISKKLAPNGKTIVGALDDISVDIALK